MLLFVSLSITLAHSLTLSQSISTTLSAEQVTVRHVVQVEGLAAHPAVCQCVPMGSHEGQGQAPYAQPTHQQGKQAGPGFPSGVVLCVQVYCVCCVQH